MKQAIMLFTFMLTAATPLWAQTTTSPRGVIDAGFDPVIFAANEARMRQSDNLRIEGQKALSKGETARGVALLQQSLKVDTNMYTSRYLLADVYIEQKRTADVLNILRPLIYPPDGLGPKGSYDLQTGMKYVLALLDTRQWAEAATLYERSIGLRDKDRAYNLQWLVYGYGGDGEKQHWLPDVHFSPDVEDIPGLRAQAHLVLGAHWPVSEVMTDDSQRRQYMLDHVRLSLRSNPRSLDAQFVSGVLLREMGRYDEARTAFARTAQMAPAEAQPEIKAALDKMNRREEQKKADDAQQAKKQAAQGKTSP